MTKETIWIEQFTGMSVTDGTARPGASLADAGAAFEKKRMAQLALLHEVREKLQQFKTAFQAAMAAEIKAGKFKGQKLLDEKKTQTDEIEFSDLKISEITLSPEAARIVGEGSQLVINQNERLKAARIEIDGKAEPLFTDAEIQAEYWTPLMRERILPETYIPAAYSETQQMLDQTNELYLAAVEDKKAKGKLTPKSSRGKDILGSASDVMDLTGSLIGQFAPGTQDFKLATTVLGTSAAVLRQGAEVYDKVKDREFGDAASTALDVMSTITSTVLEQCGVGKDTTRIVKASFAAGSAAIAAGQAFAKGVDGAEDGLDALGTVCSNALNAAMTATSDPKAKEGLKYAAAVVPGAFKQAALAANLRQKIMDEDYAGIVTCLGKSMQSALTGVQQLREIKATQGKTEEEAAKIKKEMKAQTADLANYFDLGTTGAEVLVKTAITARRGEHMAALNELIGGVGGALKQVLVTAGVPKNQAGMIADYYTAAASAPAALECLLTKPPKVDAALKKLSGGITTACAQSGNETLEKVGVGLSMSLNAVATGLETKALYEEGKYNEGVAAFYEGLQEQLKTVFQLPALKAPETDDDDDGDDSDEDADGDDAGDDTPVDDDTPDDDTPSAMTPADAQKAVAALLADLGAATGDAVKGAESRKKLREAERKLRAKQKAARTKADEADARLIVQEALADLDALSKPQQAGADASSIDRLIAKMERDRMVMKLARQIAEGGTAFLAKFVPALGAASAGIKLAANLFAAGQRGQQLYKWMQLQDDFEAAQSALSSSSRNFVRNQGEQLAHYSAQAIFAATELAGEIVKLAGPASPAGAILSAVASSGSALQGIVEKHKSREDLEKAWNTTVLALRNPGNRKLGLEARALNGSLAKYAIAWGAVTLKDPLARNAMKACDLNEASLNDENANVDKVVAYLESFYEDDASLYRELDETPAWVPGDLNLGLKSWARLKRQAVDRSQLRAPETGKLDGWLALYEARSADQAPAEAAAKARKAWADAVAAALKAAPKGKRPAVPVTEQKAMAAALAAQIDALEASSELLEQLVGGFKAYVPLKKTADANAAADADAAAMLRAVASLARLAEKTAALVKKDLAGLQAQFDEVSTVDEEAPVTA
jgi:hypothetical protein